MAVDRNIVLSRIAERMINSANKHRTIGCPVVFSWGDLIQHLSSSSDEFLLLNRDNFSEYLREGEWQ